MMTKREAEAMSSGKRRIMPWFAKKKFPHSFLTYAYVDEVLRESEKAVYARVVFMLDVTYLGWSFMEEELWIPKRCIAA